MTYNAIQLRNSIKEEDLTTPTEDRKYPLGLVIDFEDESEIGGVKSFVYVRAHAALTQYQPYVYNFTSTDEEQVATSAPATLASAVNKVIVPQVEFQNDYYGFVQLVGDAKVLMSAETYVVGDHLEVLNGGTTAIVDGTSGATTRGVGSFGICKEAGSTAEARDCYLSGLAVEVAAT